MKLHLSCLEESIFGYLYIDIHSDSVIRIKNTGQLSQATEVYSQPLFFLRYFLVCDSNTNQMKIVTLIDVLSPLSSVVL